MDKKKRNSLIRYVVLIVIFVIVALALYLFFTSDRGEVYTAPVSPVIVEKPEWRTINEGLSVTGYIEAEAMIPVVPFVSGTVEEYPVTAGCEVEEGSTIAVIDKKPYELQLKQAEAQVDEDLAPLPDKDSGKKLAAIESTLSNSFWVTMQEGYEDAAEEYGVSIDIQATDSDTDTAGQLDILNNMLVQDYDAIAVSPLTEDCLISGIVSANQQGVTVITTGNEVNEEALEEAGGSLDAKITVDFHNQGVLGAQYIVDQNNGEGQVAIIAGNEGATQSDARRDGANETFE